MIALVDCNNFFASCERLFRPDLLNKPVAVLSSNDGCVVARSNEVKALGVPMGVPHFQVKQIFDKNNVTVFSSNFALYSTISQRIIYELEQTAPKIEVYSIDEAFLDLTNLNIKDYEQWGGQLKERIQKNVGVPVSVGIAPNKTLAKLAGDWAKKHGGVCLLDPVNKNTYQKVLKESSVQDVWGIGRQSAKKLIGAGVSQVWHLTKVQPGWIRPYMGINGERLLAELSGKQVYKIETFSEAQKSMVSSRSFGSKVTNLYELETAIASFTTQIAARLRRFNQNTEIFGVFVVYKEGENNKKYANLSTHLMPPTNNTSELTEVAIELTKRLFVEGIMYKKAGVFAYQLSSADVEQVSLLDKRTLSERERQKKLMNTIDLINARFGSSAIKLASIDSKQVNWHASQKLKSPAFTTSWNELPQVYA